MITQFCTISVDLVRKLFFWLARHRSCKCSCLLSSSLANSFKAFTANLDKVTLTYAEAIARFLREPRKATNRILAANTAFLQTVEFRRNSLQTDTQIRARTLRQHFCQREDYQALLKMDKRSRIIATYHFGDFIYGLNYLMSLSESGQRRAFFSQENSSAAYFHNMQKAFGDRAMSKGSQLVQGQVRTATLACLLREQGSLLVMFCDLPDGFGKRIAVDFMGRKAWFPKGAATLSVTNRVPVLPVINIVRDGRHEIILGQQLEPRLFSEEPASIATRRIVQQLVRFFETFFRDNPEQWRYLQFLPRYFEKKVID
jgi:hypothetical protein